MPTPGGIDVTHSSKGCLHPARHLFQEHLKVGNFLLVDDNTTPREERVPVAIHQHALHHRLREPRPLGASAAPLSPPPSRRGADEGPTHPRRGLGSRAHLRGGRGGSPAPRGGITTTPGEEKGGGIAVTALLLPSESGSS
uniref:Uncharacterized protein n=1 Tax=Buteo japonicus TaxID=224669 RepID=A0A8C0HP64_9AVES